MGNRSMLRPMARLAAVLLLLLPVADVVAAEPQPRDPLAKAYAFLYEQMDRFWHGSTLRLVQSYVPTATFSNGDISYTYDDDAMLIAFLARGAADDHARARGLGDSILYVQAHDPARDGRVRDAYRAKEFIGAGGTPNIANAASHTGNLAWTGMALAQLYRATNDPKYLKAALALANFAQQNSYDPRGI